MLTAQHLRSAGLPCFPCNEQKRPMVKHWQADASAPLNNLPPSNLQGVPVPAGVMVLDLDTYKGITREMVEEFLGTPLPWDEAFIQTTKNGGEHYAFRAPEWEVRQGSRIGLDGLDTRAAGKGYICTGQGYTPVGLFGPLAMSCPTGLPVLPDGARHALEKPVLPEREQVPTGTADAAKLRAALAHVSPDCARSEWVKIGLALKSGLGDDGFGIFDEWSRGELNGSECPANYSQEDQETQWASFKEEGGITVGTLYHMALAGGWSPPRDFDCAAVFGDKSAPIADILENGANPLEMGRLLTLCAGDIVLSAVLTRELKAAGIITKEIKEALAGKKPAGPVVPMQDGEELIPCHVPLSPDRWLAFHTKGKDSQPLGTYENFCTMLGAYGVTIRYNEIKKEIEVDGPGIMTEGTLKDEWVLSHIDSLSNLNKYPKTDNRAMIMKMAAENPYNPVLEFVRSVPWDGRDHIGELWKCLGLWEDEDEELAEVLFRKWMRGAVAIGTGYTEAMEYVLTLVDPAGGKGKTRFFSSLFPADLSKEGIRLDVSNKDSLKIATSYWGVELGELDGTFRKSDIAALKSHLSNVTDEIRLPYARAYLRYPRRTAYLATVNGEDYLTDNSENRRFWTIKLKSVNYAHSVDIQQAWAQAFAQVVLGMQWHLNPEEAERLATKNKDFKTHSTVVDLLSWKLPTVPATGDEVVHLTVTHILRYAGLDKPNKGELNEAAAWLRERGFTDRKTMGIRGFIVPQSLTKFT